MRKNSRRIFESVCKNEGAYYPKGFNNPVKELKDYCIMYFIYKGQLEECLIDKKDLKSISCNTTWVGNINGSKDKVYIVGTRLGKKISLHRALTKCPDGMVVDHINGNTFDNRRCNIRVVTPGVNMLNKKKYNNNTTGITNINRVNGNYRINIVRQFNDFDIAIMAQEEIKKIVDYYSNLDASKRITNVLQCICKCDTI